VRHYAAKLIEEVSIRARALRFQAHFYGRRFLLSDRFVARHFRELTCWQLARSLKMEVMKILKKPVFERNLRSRENLSDAASSARRNIAEGFGRRGHKEFARFLNISLSSLKEVEDGLIESLDNEWITESEVAEALRYCKRATVATTRLRNSIKDKPDPPWCT
jgi:four helix bundle protein